MAGKTAKEGARVPRQPPRCFVVLHIVLFLATAVAVALTTHDSHWRLGPLVVIVLFSVASDATAVETGTHRLKISGSFLGIILASVLLGGGPAVVIGIATVCAGWVRWREPRHIFLNNLATYAWFPFVTAVSFHGLVTFGHTAPHDVGYYLSVFAVFVFALSLNFIGVVGYHAYLGRSSLAAKVHDVVLPVLSADLFSALLTMAAVYVAVELGTTGIALFGMVLLIFQYLIGELLKSKHRGEELRRRATTDELTGLPNREFFRARLDERIAASRASDEHFGVMLCDLDRFKEINDTLGHHFGDELLRDLGPRLEEAIGPDGLVARLGGDEFAVLPGENTADADQLEAIARKLIACVQQPVGVDEMMLEVGVSIGIARFPRDGHDPHSLLRSADVAMYAAKEAHAGCKVYAAALDRHSVRRLSVLSEFRRALDSDEIVVFYQPIMHMDGARVHGAEALVRWQHPELGLLPPSDFMPIVEQTGLIGPMTRHVLERAVAQCAAWRQAAQELTVSVNLSVRNLLDPDLPSLIADLLTIYRLDPAALELEITESMLMSDPDRSLITLTRLSQLGVGLSVDDYGTGYSSLANLRRLPIDELKIDRSFVSPMLSDESDLIIVRSTINLGHDLGLKVVAEGVEDEATLHRLEGLGCDLAQGYYFSKPLPPEAFNKWMGVEVAPPQQPAPTAFQETEQAAA
ncbi:MAG TPA: EAL domain-containing protein [Solirubrobacteraceae bacterium]|nr:EAL domain-containing protein [Solirubrobacteraceae bacterium]